MLRVEVGTLADQECGKDRLYPRMIPRVVYFIRMAADAARHLVNDESRGR
jgi:hypothetical protein